MGTSAGTPYAQLETSTSPAPAETPHVLETSNSPVPAGTKMRVTSRAFLKDSGAGFGPWPAVGRAVESQCAWGHSAWRAYWALHLRIRNDQAPARYLIFERDTMRQGLGATLNGLCTCLYLAMMSARALIIRWENPMKLETIFDARFTDWRWGASKAKIQSLKASDQTRAQFVNHAATNMQAAVKLVKSSTAAIFLETNMVLSSPWAERLRLERLGLPNVTIWDLVSDRMTIVGCGFHSLFKIRDHGPFADLWARAEASVPPGPRVGVHLRLGDSVWTQHSKDWRDLVSNKDWGVGTSAAAAQQAVACAQQLATHAGFQNPCVVIYESDDYTSKGVARTAGKNGSPCYSWTSGSKPVHERWYSDKSKARESWLALMMLTRVDVLITSISTFSYAAAAIGPGLVQRSHVVGFEQALRRRFELGRARNDTRDLCRMP